MDLITLKTFDSLVDAHLTKATLENEGISCYLFDENMVGLYPMYNVTVGGIKLKINSDDLEKASAVLDTIDQNALKNEEGINIKCPRCNSNDLYYNYNTVRNAKGIFSILLSYLFGIYPPYYEKVFKCKVCATEFRIKENDTNE